MSGVTITIDRENCTACQTCMGACFLDVLRWDEQADRPVVAYPEDCVWCYACELACPAQCIDVKPAETRRIPSPY
jgi:NAD-dependent dihydropyrimidine dehydrogenase PreA subunit